MTLLRLILLATVACTTTAAHSSTGLEVSAEVADASVVVGKPLVLRLTVHNTRAQTIDLLDVSSSSFTLTHYLGMVETRCSVEVYVTSPDPGDPRPPLFGFTWLVESLAPKEARICEVELPATVIPGTETVTIYGAIEGQVEPKTAFTYSVVSGTAPPQPVPASSTLGVLLLFASILVLGARSRRMRVARRRV
jgi:hypothetical protein